MYIELFVYFILGLGLFCAVEKNTAMFLSHILNNIFGLPHPGPNDIQGSCWCRRHEGPHKYTFQDYVQNLFARGRD